MARGRKKNPNTPKLDTRTSLQRMLDAQKGLDVAIDKVSKPTFTVEPGAGFASIDIDKIKQIQQFYFNAPNPYYFYDEFGVSDTIKASKDPIKEWCEKWANRLG